VTMSKILSLITILPIIALISCNKDDDNTAPKKTLDYIEDVVNGDLEYIDFNNKGDIIRDEFNEFTRTVSISGNKVSLVEYDKSKGQNDFSAEYDLDANGNFVSGQASVNENTASAYVSDFTFTYTADGHLLRSVDDESNGDKYTVDYIWANGDLTRRTVTLNGTLLFVQDFEYANFLPDKLGINFHNDLKLPNTHWLGKLSEHLVTREHYTFPASPGEEIDYHFVYTLDNDKYVSSFSREDVAHSAIDVIAYHYE
ncbi:MAG TPA: DUF4595 domain-containing protein, partial [Saprospiraceae bacterium]|nr:DUF4595 domain-containing protein [Saprospiraceae bacterium]